MYMVKQHMNALLTHDKVTLSAKQDTRDKEAYERSAKHVVKLQSNELVVKH